MIYILVFLAGVIAGIYVHKLYADKANAEQAKLSAAVSAAKANVSQAVSDLKK